MVRMAYIEENDLSVLIVTYADHRKYLKESIKRLEKYSKYISNVIIVQNGVKYNLSEFINNQEAQGLRFVEIVNEENLGSSGGFGLGIDKSLHVDGKMLMILDDDNYVPEDSFNNIRGINISNLESHYNSKIAISLNRPLHDRDFNKFERDSDHDASFFYNTICQFSFLHRISYKSYSRKRLCKNIAEMYVAPYSGLVINKEFIREVEPIQENYYLYGDDTRWTARLSESGVKILSMKNIYSIDISQSWNKEEKQNKNDVWQFLNIYDRHDLWRPFYTIRNGVYSSKKVFKRGNLVYYVNLFIFSLVPFFVYMPKNKIGLRNYKYFIMAVVDGSRGRLGKEDPNFF